MTFTIPAAARPYSAVKLFVRMLFLHGFQRNLLSQMPAKFVIVGSAIKKDVCTGGAQSIDHYARARTSLCAWNVNAAARRCVGVRDVARQRHKCVGVCIQSRKVRQLL